MLGQYPRDQWGDKVREMIAAATPRMTRTDRRWWLYLWEHENMLYGGDACWQIDCRSG